MSTIRCTECNLVNWATEMVCKRCGRALETAEAGPTEVNGVNATGGEQSFVQTNVSNNAGATSFQPPMAQPAHRTEFNPSNPFSGQSEYGTNYQNGFQPNYNAGYKTPGRTIKLALVSMILGIIGFPPVSFIVAALIGTVLGIIFGTTGAVIGLLLFLALIPTALISGIIALRRASRRPAEYGGKGFAIAGIACSSLSFIFTGLISVIAIPNLLAARRAANEAAAISTVKKLSTAEVSYMSSMNGKCGDIQTLIATKLMDTTLAKNEKSGYRFVVSNLPAGGCEIHATPLQAQGISATGKRSFYASSDEDWLIRSAEKNGSPASSSDRVLDDGLSSQRPKIASY
jgi:hypothetical protein